MIKLKISWGNTVIMTSTGLPYFNNILLGIYHAILIKFYASLRAYYALNIHFYTI